MMRFGLNLLNLFALVIQKKDWLIHAGVFVFTMLVAQFAIAGPVAGLSLEWPVPTGDTQKPGQDYAQFSDGSTD